MKRIPILWILSLGVALLGLTSALRAQAPTPIAQPVTGTPPFGSFGGGPFDVLNLANLNTHFEIPIVQKAGRGTPFSFNLVYDSSFWYPAWVGGTITWEPLTTYGWNSFVPTYAFGTFSSKIVSTYTQPCDPGHGNFNPVTIQVYSMFAYYDTKGTAHPFPGSTSNYGGSGCVISAPPMTLTGVVAYDGSGYVANISQQSVTSLKDRDGTSINTNASSSFTTDANGNRITSLNGVYTDTLGQTALTITGTNPVLLTYTAPNASPAKFKVYYTSKNIKTNFGCSLFGNPIGEYSANGVPLITEIDLPDNSKYLFSYQATPGFGSFTTGRISQVTLPTGGTIAYTYPGSNDGVSCADGSAMHLTRTLTPGGVWAYDRANPSGTLWTTTITSPPDPVNSGNASDVTTINFSQDGTGNGFYETQRKVYQGAAVGTPLSYTYNCWNNNFTNCDTQSVSSPITQLDAFTQLNGGATGKVETLYNTYGLATDVKQYDWNNPTTPSKETVITYANLTNGIVDHPASVIVKDGSGNVVAKMTYGYDESAVAPTSGTPQIVGVVGSRGNVTTINTYTSGSTYLSKHFTYYDTGNLNQATDVNNAVTTYTYGACGNSFPTQVSMPLSLSTSATWDCVGGVQLTSTDVNGNPTTTNYNDPYFWRPASITYPDGGQTSFTYYSSTVTTTTRKINGTQNLVTETALDGFGRIIEKEISSDPGGAVYADTFYNSLGQAYCFSNPYRATSGPTDGHTCYEFDALGRTTKVTNPDGSYQTITYSNRATEVQDEGNGTLRIAKIYQSDGLGRLTSVCEITSVTQLGNGATPSACGQDIAATGFLTTYGYDTVGDLSSVTQNGLNSRSYSYDQLSRLTSESNPESGTAAYTYDSCSAGDLCTRVRPRANQTNPAVTTTTSYAYDVLHRLTGKSYNDSLTSSANYYYDQAAPWGWNVVNPKGHLSSQVTSNMTAQMFEYDSMGRLIETGINTPLNWSGNAYHFTATYDLLGDLLTENNDREGVTYTNNYNTAAQLTSFQSNLVNSSHPGTLFTVNQYNPLGEVQQATFGNGIVSNATYDNRGRITSQTDGSIYSFTLGLAPNNDVLTGNDSVNGNWVFTYDGFNRLATSNKNSGQQTFTYLYDRFGNRWQQNAPQGGPAPQYMFTSSNQISGSGITYDAAGNVTNDGLGHSYTYDAEGRMLTVGGNSTATYTYDANGQRLEETVNGGAPIDFIYDVRGHLVTQATASVWQRSELYAGNAHVALYANGTTYFMHNDWLGTTKNQSDMSGNSAQWCSYLPFGDGFSCPGSQLSLMSFTGDQWDGETYLNHTLFRQQNPFQGRWMTPDPAGLAAVDPANPQSWNRYAYVMNSPLNFVDPLGLDTYCTVTIYYQKVTTYNSTGEPVGPPEYQITGAQADPGSCSTFCPMNNGWGIVGGQLVCGPPSQVQSAIAAYNAQPGLGTISSTTVRIPLTAQSKSKCPPSTSSPPKSNLEKLVNVIGTITHPFDIAAVNSSMFVVSGAAFTGGGLLVGAGCLEPTPFEPVTCTAGGLGGGVLFATGGASAKAGVDFFKKYTLPAFANWGCPD